MNIIWKNFSQRKSVLDDAFMENLTFWLCHSLLRKRGRETETESLKIFFSAKEEDVQRLHFWKTEKAFNKEKQLVVMRLFQRTGYQAGH